MQESVVDEVQFNYDEFDAYKNYEEEPMEDKAEEEHDDGNDDDEDNEDGGDDAYGDDDEQDEDYIEEDSDAEFDDEDDIEENIEIINFTKAEFVQYCSNIGLKAYLTQLFNTKVTSNVKENVKEATLRAVKAMNKCFVFIVYSMKDIHQNRRKSSSSSDPGAAASHLAAEERTVLGVVLHILKHFGYFLPRYLDYFYQLGRKANTVKPMLKEFDEVFLKFILLSSEAKEHLNDSALVGYSLSS
jgi:uncharacterized membrane protein (DUF485 family)